jgi:hypothetical protein
MSKLTIKAGLPEKQDDEENNLENELVALLSYLKKKIHLTSQCMISELNMHDIWAKQGHA